MSHATVELLSGRLEGDGVVSSVKLLSQLENVFADETSRAAMAQDTVVYQVQSQMLVKEGEPGGLFFGTSNVMPGKVGQEYFMTKGHYHAKRECAEYYWCIQGQGALLLMDEAGNTTMEPMFPGSLHYIPGYVAHRLANTGSEVLRVGACWPSDAGHDYGSITETGFSARLMDVDGVPTLVPSPKA